MSMMNQKQMLAYIKKINKSNIDYWQKRSLNRLATSEIYTDARLPFIYEMYDGAYRQVDKMINEVFRTYGDALGGLDREKLKEMVLTNQGLGNYNARITRLESIKQDIEEKVMDMYANVEQAQEILYTNVLNNNYRNTINDISSLKGLSANFIEKGGAFATIDKRLVKALLKEPWTGNKNFSKRTWGQAKDLNAKLGKYINQAMISGQSYARVSREVRQAFEVKKYEADRLVRTEMNYFHNQADLLANEELGINKYQYLAVMDNRTSEVCEKLDGEVFDTKDAKVGLNYPPMHPNCRSTTIPYLGKDKIPKKFNSVISTNEDETKLIDKKSPLVDTVKINKNNNEMVDITDEVKALKNGGNGRLIKGFTDKKPEVREREQAVGEWLISVIGGEIDPIETIKDQKTPDAKYVNKLLFGNEMKLEIKSPIGTENSIKKAFKKAREQIFEYDLIKGNGILLLDLNISDKLMEERLHYIYNRFALSAIGTVIIKNRDELIKFITK